MLISERNRERALQATVFATLAQPTPPLTRREWVAGTVREVMAHWIESSNARAISMPVENIVAKANEAADRLGLR